MQEAIAIVAFAARSQWFVKTQCVLCCSDLGRVVDWKVVDGGDEALSDQLTVGGRGFSLHKVRLHPSHLGLESPARETMATRRRTLRRTPAGGVAL